MPIELQPGLRFNSFLRERAPPAEDCGQKRRAIASRASFESRIGVQTVAKAAKTFGNWCCQPKRLAGSATAKIKNGQNTRTALITDCVDRRAIRYTVQRGAIQIASVRNGTLK